MKIKRAILMLTVVSLLVAIPALAAKKPTGALGPPLWDDPAVEETTATIDEVEDVDVIRLDWLPVTGADKYSVDIEATATYDTGEVDEEEQPIMASVEVSASFGTSDRLDGGDMSDDDLNIPLSDIEAIEAALDAALAEALELAGLDPETPAVVEITAKVKALDPSVKPTKRQNNPFSVPVALP